MTTYASVCSGIESPSVAWKDFDWKPIWFSEIESNACKILKHHYTAVPNLGDMTKIVAMIESEEIEAPDILVGGTPCQAFSVAGLRKGLEDARGNLTLVFADLINACDRQRTKRGLQPTIVVWENVPGVLSDKTNAFGNYLSLLSGEDEEITSSDGKWTNAGCVFGPQRAIVWRVLDAQYFGVPQRRRRVFLIASARKGFRPQEILFEFEGLRRDIAPSREKREDHPEGTERSIGSGRKGIDFAGCDTTGEGARLDSETCSLVPFRVGGISEYKEGVGTLRAFGGDSGGGSETVLAFNHQSGGSLMNLQPSENLANTVQRCQGQAVSVRLANTSSNGCGFQEETNHTLDRAAPNAVFAYTSVRKLTPTECERLMGFPDGYTSMLADSNRYKVLGNSIVTNCLKWLGGRINNKLKAQP